MEGRLVSLLIFVGILLFLSVLRRRRYPPGPRGWPVIGNMDMMAELTNRGLARLAKQYGDVFCLRLGSLRMVIVSSPDAARQVLQKHDAVFANRSTNIAIRYLSYETADMAFANYGPMWRQMRKICVVKLFSRRRAESWDSVRYEVDAMIRIVASRAGSAVNVTEIFSRLTMNIVYRAAFGSIISEEQHEFIEIIHEFSELFGAFNFADIFPVLRWLDPHGLNRRLVKARKSLDRFIDRIIDDHIEKKKQENFSVNADMVDELLDFYSDDSRVPSSDSINLTRENIKAIIMDVMFGGTETVAAGIDWAMAELMRSPEDLSKVQGELADVVGLGRRVEEGDCDKLTYLPAALKEVLRLHPPIPSLVHEAAADAAISGYHIPKGARVVINAWAIGRDPSVWEDPEEFRPSRFLKDGAPDFKGSNFEFLPFGSGRRSCPGMQLGFYAVEKAIANLLHCFTWELADGAELDMKEIFGATMRRAGALVAIPTPRLLCPLF